MASKLHGGSHPAASTRRSLLAMGATGLLAGGAAIAITDATSKTQADAATTATTPAWVNVTSYGADPTGASDSAGAFNDAVTAVANAGGGVVYIPAGGYKIESTVTCTTVPVYFVGDGAWATIISFYGTGDCFRIYDSSTYSARTKFGGGIVGITIDGSNAGAGSTGLHVGDLLQYEVDLTVQSFRAGRRHRRPLRQQLLLGRAALRPDLRARLRQPRGLRLDERHLDHQQRQLRAL